MTFRYLYNVMLNLFQHPFLLSSGGFWGKMDAEINSA